jgi:hypothetical protein
LNRISYLLNQTSFLLSGFFGLGEGEKGHDRAQTIEEDELTVGSGWNQTKNP